MPETDINKPPEGVPYNPFGYFIPFNENEGKFEYNRTDIELEARIFFNPITWLRIAVYLNRLDGYGLRIGPFSLVLHIKMIYTFEPHKNE